MELYDGLCWISGGEEMGVGRGIGRSCPYMNRADNGAFGRVILLDVVSASLKGCVRILSRWYRIAGRAVRPKRDVSDEKGGCWEVKIPSEWYSTLLSTVAGG